MRRAVKVLIAAGVTLGAALGVAAPASASIVTSEASLVNGQLTIVGSGAVPDSTVSVDDGPPTDQADAQGNFSLSASGFSALLSPAPGASFADGHVVIFRWHTGRGLSSDLQVASNPAFTNPAVDINTNTAQAWAVISPLPSGTLYWRVLGVDVYGADGPSPAVRTFTVRPPSGPLPAPVPEFPANGATVTQGQQVAFFWQPVSGAASYELQVANSSAFTSPLVLDHTVTGNQVNTTKLPTGTLFWRVRARDSQGPGAWSVTFQLTVAPS